MDSQYLSLVSQVEANMKITNVSLTPKNKHNPKYLKLIQSNRIHHVYMNSPPPHLQDEFDELLTAETVKFLVELIDKFDDRFDWLYKNRLYRKAEIADGKIPQFTTGISTDRCWQVAPVPNRLKNRQLDLGDVSPSDRDHFTKALCADVQGIQVDFDDGHCPSWSNQIFSLHNVVQAVTDRLPNTPKISHAPILMLRPRAWNMIEMNVNINGKNIPGPIFDFSILIFHCAKILYKQQCGPCFYLSKLECADEAKLWDDIFTWTEKKIDIPHGSIKACVLIENICASFELENILYHLRDHSLGLNCGIWDYAASIIAKFGDKSSFMLPDRRKYVNMNQRFLKKYMQLIVKVCHDHGAHATGGMAAQMLPKELESDEYQKIVKIVSDIKMTEILMGVDGFMVYDVQLVPYMKQLWASARILGPNQLSFRIKAEAITAEDLLSIPHGGVTMDGLKHNIKVTIFFIYAWLMGKGHFFLDGCVEDSATAEISRSQIWQWMRHGAKLEDIQQYNNDYEHDDDVQIVTKKLVNDLTDKIVDDSFRRKQFCKELSLNGKIDRQKLLIAKNLFSVLVNSRYFPNFITSYLYDAYPFTYIKAHL